MVKGGMKAHTHSVCGEQCCDTISLPIVCPARNLLVVGESRAGPYKAYPSTNTCLSSMCFLLGKLHKARPDIDITKRHCFQKTEPF